MPSSRSSRSVSSPKPSSDDFQRVVDEAESAVRSAMSGLSSSALRSPRGISAQLITLSLYTWMTTAVLLWCTDCIIPPRLIDLISDRANCSVFVMPVISPVSWKSRMSCSGNVLLGFDDVLQFSDHSMHCVTDHVSYCFFRVLKFV